MTAIRTSAITSAVLAAVFAASVSGAAIAGDKKQNQSGGTTPPSDMTVQTDDNQSANTAATIAIINTILAKCKNNMLPRCP